MKKIFFTLIIALAFSVSSLSFAGDTWVNGYTKSNGTHVQGYHRTTPNSTRNDNYSTRGNTNPYTGTRGTKPRDNGYGSYGSRSNSSRSNNTLGY